MFGNALKGLTLEQLRRYIRHEYRNLLVWVPFFRFTARTLVGRFFWKRESPRLNRVPEPLVINLPFRPERRARMQVQLRRIGLNGFSFHPAVVGRVSFPHPAELSGKRGCAASHIEVLRKHLHSRTPLLVMEDDIDFIPDAKELHATVQHFLNSREMDVLCLHSWSARSLRADEMMAIATDITSTAAYLVKPRAIRFLLRDFQRSAKRLAKGKNLPIDHAWWRGQRWNLVFVIPHKPLATQVDGQSDISGR